MVDVRIGKSGFPGGGVGDATHRAPVIDEWVKKLSQAIVISDDKTYLLRHLIGCQTIIRYLERADTKVGGVLLENEVSEAIAKP